MTNLITRESDQYVNASVLCKTSDKQFSQYLLLQSVQSFLSELSEILKLPVEVLVQKGERGRGKDQATWIHPTVAVHLGQWLSPANAASAIAFLWQELESKKLAESLLQTKLIESSEAIAAQQNQIKTLEPFKQTVEKIEEKRAKILEMKNFIIEAITRRFSYASMPIATALDILDEVFKDQQISGYDFKNPERIANIQHYYRIRGVKAKFIRHEIDLSNFLSAVGRGYQTPGLGGSGQAIILKQMFDPTGVVE